MLANSALVHPSLLCALPLLFPQTCAIQEGVTTRDEYGQINPDKTYTTVEGLECIPCRLSTPGTTNGTEINTQSIQAYTISPAMCALKGSYPQITTKHRALIGDVLFDIWRIRYDAEGVMTVLELQVVR